jgi:hypothetical protein
MIVRRRHPWGYAAIRNGTLIGYRRIKAVVMSDQARQVMRE